MPAFCLSGLLRFYAADDIVLSGVLHGQSHAHERRYDHFIIIICRKSDTCTSQLRSLQHQRMRGSVPYTDGKGRLGQENMGGSADAHKGQVIGHIQAVLVLTAYDHVLKQAVACKSFCTGCITAFIQII